MLPPLCHCSYWNRSPQFFASSTARSHFSSCSREAVASILAWFSAVGSPKRRVRRKYRVSRYIAAPSYNQPLVAPGQQPLAAPSRNIIW